MLSTIKKDKLNKVKLTIKRPSGNILVNLCQRIQELSMKL